MKAGAQKVTCIFKGQSHSTNRKSVNLISAMWIGYVRVKI